MEVENNIFYLHGLNAGQNLNQHGPRPNHTTTVQNI